MKYNCGRCFDTGEVIVSYVPRYETCPVCKGTLVPQKSEKKTK